MEGASVVVRLVAFGLELALQLHSVCVATIVLAYAQLCPLHLPVSCSPALHAPEAASHGREGAYRILTVSKGCVAVTAPQAAMPPAMKALQARISRLAIPHNWVMRAQLAQQWST